MQNIYKHMALMIVFAVLFPIIAYGVSLEKGDDGPSSSRLIPIPTPLHHPCCDMGSCLDCPINARVGSAIQVGTLWIYPIIGAPCQRDSFMTMDDALEKGRLLIHEQGQGQVPFLNAENISGTKILILGGEMIRGGKQNRIVSQDILLPPHSGLVRIPVFCGEKNRWTDSKGKFSGNKILAPAKLRGSVYTDANQDKVWSGIKSHPEYGISLQRR